MIKRLFMLACVATMAVTASAQITWNAKGGVGVATCYGLDSDDGGSLKNHFVGKVGFGIEKPLSANWSLMPSLEIAWKGSKYEYYDEKETLNLCYIQIPVVAAYRINLSNAWNMTIKAGPYFAYNLSSKLKYEDSYDSGEEDLDVKKFDAGLDAGVDFEYHRFVFGVEAEWGFMKLIDELNMKNLAFYATIGWKF